MPSWHLGQLLDRRAGPFDDANALRLLLLLLSHVLTLKNLLFKLVKGCLGRVP